VRIAPQYRTRQSRIAVWIFNLTRRDTRKGAPNAPPLKRSCAYQTVVVRLVIHGEIDNRRT
jgi:hypothetical protein